MDQDMLQRVKSSDSEAENPIYKKIKQIQDFKAGMMLQITTHFIEFKKKTDKLIEKTEKYFHQRVNEACLNTLDSLRKVAESEDLDSFQLLKFQRKADKVVAAFKKVQIEPALALTSDKLRMTLEDLKRSKEKLFDNIPQLSAEDNLLIFERKMKIDTHQSIKKLKEINGKVLKIGETSASIDKYTLNKKIDLAIEVRVATKKEKSELPKEKKKSILFMLHDQLLAIYNDKLVQHSQKAFPYTLDSIVDGKQLGNYLFIAEKHKISKINLSNIDQIYVKGFGEEIQTLCSDLHDGDVAVGCGSQILTLSFDSLQILFRLDCESSVVEIKSFGQRLVALTETGIQIYRKLELENIFRKAGVSPLRIINISETEFLLVSRQSHFVYYNLEITDPEQEAYKMLNSNISNKMIKDVSVSGTSIMCLSDSGFSMFLYSF